MKTTPSNFPFIESYTDFSGSHLPEFESLDRIDNRWFIFGTLTYAKTPPRPATQLADFVQLMDVLGQQNRSHPDLLHWFARVEYSPGKLYHLHFILGEERIKNGYDHPMSVEETCQFLKNHWGHGMAEVEQYDPSEDGVGYITKTINTDKIGDTLMSPKLKRLLKKLPHSDRRENEIKEISRHHAHGRDPFITELVIKLGRIKETGFIGFIDESPKWKQVA